MIKTGIRLSGSLPLLPIHTSASSNDLPRLIAKVEKFASRLDRVSLDFKGSETGLSFREIEARKSWKENSMQDLRADFAKAPLQVSHAFLQWLQTERPRARLEKPCTPLDLVVFSTARHVFCGEAIKAERKMDEMSLLNKKAVRWLCGDQ